MELALDILPQVLVDGIVLGFMYALIALGYTMVYGVLEFINFAHSEIVVLGAFVGVEILLLLESAGYLATLHTAFVLLLVILSGMLRQRSGSRGARASGLSSAPAESTTRCVDLGYRRFVFFAGRSPFFRKSLAEYFLPHLSHAGRPR